MDTNLLIGTWRFVSFEGRTADGVVRPLAGPDARGYLFYTADGYMGGCIQLRRPTDFASGDIMSGTVAEMAAAYRTLISYAGAYEVQGDHVIHHVEVSLYPNWIGGQQVRSFTFEGEQLALSTDPILYGGIEYRGYLIWERVTAEG